MKRAVDLKDVAMVARKLRALQSRFVFAGGSVVSLLLDNPEVSFIRPTGDVDVISEVTTRIRFTDLEELLRGLGFRHDTSEGAPICRWIVEDTKVDVLPMRDPTGAFSDRWFETAFNTARPVGVLDQEVLVVSAPSFIAMKIEAFNNRGDGDFMASHDIEDLLTIVDGRESLIREIQEAPAPLRQFIVTSVADFLAHTRFIESLPGHLPPDSASQLRLPSLLARLREIAALVGSG